MFWKSNLGATPEIIRKIHDILLADRRMKWGRTAKVMGVSHISVVSILNDYFL